MGLIAILATLAAGLVIGAFLVLFLVCATAKHVMGKALGW